MTEPSIPQIDVPPDSPDDVRDLVDQVNRMLAETTRDIYRLNSDPDSFSVAERKEIIERSERVLTRFKEMREHLRGYNLEWSAEWPDVIHGTQFAIVDFVADPYSKPGEHRHCRVSFHPVMTDNEVRDLLEPFVPETIKRNEDTGIVTFWDASWIEEGEVRHRFMQWWNERIAKEPPRKPFVFEEYLLSIGLDPTEADVLELMMDDGPRKYRFLKNGRMKLVDVSI